MQRLAALTYAMAGPGQPQAGFAALDTALGQLVGHRLFTVVAWDAPNAVNRRVHSSRPADYPVGGAKSVGKESDYHRRIIEAGEPRFYRDTDEIRVAFADHALILSLGCEACVNMPIRWDGRTVGAFNLLDAAGRYDPGMLPLLRVAAALAVAPLLAVLNTQWRA